MQGTSLGGGDDSGKTGGGHNCSGGGGGGWGEEGREKKSKASLAASFWACLEDLEGTDEQNCLPSTVTVASKRGSWS